MTKEISLDEFDYSLLIELLEFANMDYDHICLILNDILRIYEKNPLIVEHALFKDFLLINVNSKILFKKYENFFNIFDDKKASEFLDKLENYIYFMFYVIKNNDGCNEYFEQIINNLNEINKLGISKVDLNLDSNNEKEKFVLGYQPKGAIKDECGCRVFYREENIFSDVCVHDKYEMGDENVFLSFYHPKFVIKSRRIIGFSVEKGGHFNSKEWDMIIYDLNFDPLDLPSKDDLDNTRCDLESYNNLIYDKKCNLFENEMYELTGLLNILRKKLRNLNSLADDLEIKKLLKETFSSDFCEFDEYDYIMLETALCNQIDDFMDRHVRALVKNKR